VMRRGPRSALPSSSRYASITTYPSIPGMRRRMIGGFP
jgi:hypothetical protein